MNKAILKSQIRDSIRERRSLLSEEQIKEAAKLLQSLPSLAKVEISNKRIVECDRRVFCNGYFTTHINRVIISPRFG